MAGTSRWGLAGGQRRCRKGVPDVAQHAFDGERCRRISTDSEPRHGLPAGRRSGRCVPSEVAAVEPRREARGEPQPQVFEDLLRLLPVGPALLAASTICVARPLRAAASKLRRRARRRRRSRSARARRAAPRLCASAIAASSSASLPARARGRQRPRLGQQGQQVAQDVVGWWDKAQALDSVAQRRQHCWRWWLPKNDMGVRPWLFQRLEQAVSPPSLPSAWRTSAGRGSPSAPALKRRRL